MDKTSYIFEDDAVYALRNGQVIASADTMEELEDNLAEQEGDEQREASVKTADEACPNCGKSGGCDHGPDEPHDHHSAVEDTEEDAEDREDQDDEDDNEEADEERKEAATHIITPNGLKGKIMGKASGLWGDEVTVRFENGHIARIQVAEAGEFVHEASTPTEDNSDVDKIRKVLAAVPDHDEYSLRVREADLNDVLSYVGSVVEGATDDTLLTLEGFRAEAHLELTEVRDALEHIASEKEYASIAPYEISVIEQESFGGHTSSWLDKVADDMVKEANAIDYQKLLNEGPEVFVAGLDTAPLSDQGVVRTLASNHIRTKTAGAPADLRDKYESMWLERIEDARRNELSGRKQAIAKRAASEPSFDGVPDETLFI